MSKLKLIAALGGSLASAALMAGTASAQGYAHANSYGQGHYAKPHVCYEKIVTPDVYGTVKKRVIKEEGRWEVEEVAAIYGDVQKQILVKAGEWETKIEPAVYETRERQVLVEPAKTIVHVTPPVFKTEKVAHKVHDGYGHGYGHGGGYGHEKIVTYDRQVLVEPAKKSAEVVPAVYKTENFQVLVKPEIAQKIWHPPVFETKTERVIVKPAYQKKHFIPPVFDYVDEQVLVKKGHIFTKPVWKAYGEAC